MFIPAVPDKKLLNSKDEKIVNDRRILLESFLQDCSKYSYIINSREFRIFSRGPGEVNKLLEDLSRQTAESVLEKYRKNFEIEERTLSNDEYKQYSAEINLFIKFLCQAIPIAENTKKHFHRMAAAYDANYQGNRKIIKQFCNYENVAIEHYGGDDYNKRIYTHPN